VQEQNSAFFDDEDCFDLCELDDDDDDDDDDVTMPPVPPPPPPTKKAVNNNKVTSFKLNELSRHEKELQAESDRVRLEMTYEMFRSTDDCDLDDVATCSDTCQDCHATGHTLCRCCAGRKQVSLISSQPPMACPVCNAKGVEECQKCMGSGRIAKWTELSNFKPEL